MSSQIRVLELRSVRGTGGGPEKTILFGAALADKLIKVTVCYIRDQRDDIYQLDHRASSIGVDYIEVRERHSLDWRIWPRLCEIVRERHIDIVHAHEYKSDLLALLLSRRTGVIPLATAHGWTGQSVRERRLYYPADRRLLRRFPRVIAVSGEIKQDLVRHGADPARTTVILNGIDPELFRRTKREPDHPPALQFSPDQFIIGAVGRLERQKRFDLLLRACAPLFRQRSHLHLAVVGDGSLRNELLGLAATLGIQEQCHLLGHRDDIVELHHEFNMLVQSSEYEGTPNVVLEAMAMETPIVATDVGGTRELAVPDLHALVVPRHDVAALQAAIADVLGDAAAARARAVAARRRIETELSFTTRTRRLEGIYQELAQARGQGRLTSQVHSA